MSKSKHKLDDKLHPSFSEEYLHGLTALVASQVASCSLDEVDRSRWQYLAESVLAKYVGPDTAPSEVRKARAIEKWLGVELRNSRTNLRIALCDAGVHSYFFGPRRETRFSSEEVLDTARRIVLRVIGEEPSPSAVGNFSSGASTSLRREIGNVARKFTVQAHVTPLAWDYVWPELYRHQAWLQLNRSLLDPVFVEGNVLFTVPKTTDIDRVACKEPDLNMWAQKRLGDQIRKSLKRFGINLNDQTANQRLAKKGSVERNLCTLDLSSASDSMTTSLVCRLVPPAWFVELNALRSHVTFIDGVPHQNEMFSSMGNGFTFELESLLFYSIVRAVCILTGAEGRVSVYGDDIICPSSVAQCVSNVLGFCGFKVNPKKSHWKSTDHLRESCGSHFMAGYDFKPFYIKGPILTQRDLIHSLNSFRAWLDVEPFCHTIAQEVRDWWWTAAKRVDRRVWGGRDLTSRERLVTPHQPGWVWTVKRVHKKKLEEELQTGLYLQGLRSILDREVATTSDSQALLTEETSEVFLRRKKPTYWERVLPLPRW